MMLCYKCFCFSQYYVTLTQRCKKIVPRLLSLMGTSLQNGGGFAGLKQHRFILGYTTDKAIFA